MRITIIGQPCSGKSTLARAIAERFRIPHIHIDRFWFEAGGRRGAYDTPNIEQVRTHIRKKVLEATQSESWVSDGLYSCIQPEIAKRADMIVFLDIPLLKRLCNHSSRLLHRAGRHSELSLRDDLRFFLEIIKRNFTKVSKLEKFLEGHRGKIITLSSRKEIDSFLHN